MPVKSDSAVLERPDQQSSGGGKRIQFEFSQDAYDRLQRIKEQTGAATYADLVRNSLRLYEWFIDQKRQGYDIGLIKDDKLVKQIQFYF